MKAYVLHGIGDLRYEEVPSPVCPPGWAIVSVKAAGICSSDISRIYLNGTYHFPTIPGHEISGVVCHVGDAEDAVWIGRRVSVFPLIPCRKCPQCAAGHYEMCEHYDYIGSRRDGGFAEKVAVPVWNLMELPDEIPFLSGAMFEPLAVALHTVKTAGEIRGTSVTIIGTGIIGMAAVKWALLHGAASVQMVGRGEGKKPLAERMGVSKYFSDSETALEHMSDIVIEAVGSTEAIETALRMVSPGGRVVLAGNPGGDINLKKEIYWRILRKQLRIYGTWNSSYYGDSVSDWTEVAEALLCGEFDAEGLVTHIFSQEKMLDGLRMMAEKKETYCKVMTEWKV